MKTGTYRGATFISTDAHVTEPIELYADRLDEDLRPRAPRIDTRDGWRVLVVEGLSSRKLMTAVSAKWPWSAIGMLRNV